MIDWDISGELATIRDYIRWGASRFNEAELFFGHGTDNAFDEAAWLVLHTLHLPNQIAAVYLDTCLTMVERNAVIDVLRQRVEERLPAPYITHEAWFCGQPFYVDERVLIPRSPIAELIEAGFSPWIDQGRIRRVLDLCTGSGCIAIATALALPGVEVDASDISPEALEVAQINIESHGVEGEVILWESDLFLQLPDVQYDVIVTNPPYVDIDEMEARPPEYQHEPALALESGVDGLDAVRQILRDAPAFLTDGGILIVEVGASQPQMEQTFPELPLTWLTFERGGEGVFLLTKEQLLDYAPQQLNSGP